MPRTLVVFVSTRGALATLAGVPSVERHVQAGRALGLDVHVVYPPERRALGAEVRGLVDRSATCVPADHFAAGHEGSTESLLVVAAEWYLSLGALAAVRDADAPRCFGRVCERGHVSVPVARIGADEAAKVAAGLGTTSAAAALARLPTPPDCSFDLDTRSEQRLSDNVSTAHAEEKLIENLFGPPRLVPLLRLRSMLAPMLARRFSRAALGPPGISVLKLAIGLAAAWVIGSGGYVLGLAGAFLYLAARVVGASGIVLARAGLADNDLRERLDVAGDTVLHLALLWSLAGGPARGSGAITLAIVASAGVLVSTWVAWFFVLRETRQARRRALARSAGGEPVTASTTPGRGDATATGDEFISRFVQRDGIAYALLFAAAAGRLDLFVLAAAVASHLFYVLWLLARPRGESGPMVLGRAA